MQEWRQALEIFLNNWKHRDELAGVLVCGSFVTGNPTERSDIDVHLVMKEGEEWRERGNCYVDGFLIEYFCNPPVQIRKYFEEDHSDRGTHAAVQFATGEVLFDTEGTIAELKKEAGNWLKKPFEEISGIGLEFMKYAIWDSLDNLQDLYEQKVEDFTFVYHNSLKMLFNQYCQFLNIETIPYYQICSYLIKESYLKKYLKEPFPDDQFASLFLEAAKSSEKGSMIDLYEGLSAHVMRELGGFSIDGWKMRTPIQK